METTRPVAIQTKHSELTLDPSPDRCPRQILKQKTPFDEEPLYMYLAHQAVHKPLGLPPDDAFSDDELSILAAIEAESDEQGHLRARFAKVKSWKVESKIERSCVPYKAHGGS